VANESRPSQLRRLQAPQPREIPKEAEVVEGTRCVHKLAVVRTVWPAAHRSRRVTRAPHLVHEGRECDYACRQARFNKTGLSFSHRLTARALFSPFSSKLTRTASDTTTSTSPSDTTIRACERGMSYTLDDLTFS
jgi:hypothetical protein